MESGRSREHVVVLTLCLLAPAALLVLGAWLHPDPRGFGTHEQLGLRPCWPMAHWKVPCPGCGVTTAVSELAHGAPLAALRTQPLGPVLVLSALAAAAWALAGHRRGRDLGVELAHLRWSSLGKAMGTLALLAWIYKLGVVRGWF